MNGPGDARAVTRVERVNRGAQSLVCQPVHFSKLHSDFEQWKEPHRKTMLPVSALQILKSGGRCLERRADTLPCR